MRLVSTPSALMTWALTSTRTPTGVAAVLRTTFTGHKDDIVGINNLLLQVKEERGLEIPLHVDGASGGFVWPFLYPDSEWDFRLEQVHSINVSGHKSGLVCPGIGWLIFREKSDLAQDLVFSRTTTSTSSMSPCSSLANAPGWCRHTRFHPTPRTSRSCGHWSRRLES